MGDCFAKNRLAMTFLSEIQNERLFRNRSIH
jgi:hypothetical protein